MKKPWRVMLVSIGLRSIMIKLSSLRLSDFLCAHLLFFCLINLKRILNYSNV